MEVHLQQGDKTSKLGGAIAPLKGTVDAAPPLDLQTTLLSILQGQREMAATLKTMESEFSIMKGELDAVKVAAAEKEERDHLLTTKQAEVMEAIASIQERFGGLETSSVEEKSEVQRELLELSEAHNALIETQEAQAASQASMRREVGALREQVHENNEENSGQMAGFKASTSSSLANIRRAQDESLAKIDGLAKKQGAFKVDVEAFECRLESGFAEVHSTISEIENSAMFPQPEMSSSFMTALPLHWQQWQWQQQQQLQEEKRRHSQSLSDQAMAEGLVAKDRKQMPVAAGGGAWSGGDVKHMQAGGDVAAYTTVEKKSRRRTLKVASDDSDDSGGTSARAPRQKRAMKVQHISPHFGLDPRKPAAWREQGFDDSDVVHRIIYALTHEASLEKRPEELPRSFESSTLGGIQSALTLLMNTGYTIDDQLREMVQKPTWADFRNIKVNQALYQYTRGLLALFGLVHHDNSRKVFLFSKELQIFIPWRDLPHGYKDVETVAQQLIQDGWAVWVSSGKRSPTVNPGGKPTTGVLIRIPGTISNMGMMYTGDEFDDLVFSALSKAGSDSE